MQEHNDLKDKNLDIDESSRGGGFFGLFKAKKEKKMSE